MNLEALADALRTKCNMARYQCGIWALLPKLWLIENEVGGRTLLYPSDYRANRGDGWQTDLTAISPTA